MKKNYNNSRRFTKHKNTNANQTQADIQSIHFKIRKKISNLKLDRTRILKAVWWNKSQDKSESREILASRDVSIGLFWFYFLSFSYSGVYFLWFSFNRMLVQYLSAHSFWATFLSAESYSYNTLHCMKTNKMREKYPNGDYLTNRKNYFQKLLLSCFLFHLVCFAMLKSKKLSNLYGVG